MRATYETREERLRKLLEGEAWRSQRQMQAEGGLRYGARLYDAHNGDEPLHYETKTDPEDESKVFYRAAPKTRCDICQDENRFRPSVALARLAQRVAELEAENARLKGARP